MTNIAQYDINLEKLEELDLENDLEPDRLHFNDSAAISTNNSNESTPGYQLVEQTLIRRVVAEKATRFPFYIFLITVINSKSIFLQAYYTAYRTITRFTLVSQTFTAVSMYIWGILFLIGLGNANVTLYQPISPPKPILYLYTIADWPSCEDLRGQAWRIFTYQFIHGLFSFLLFY
jgi:membrane associated rhomboid family serine protease